MKKSKIYLLSLLALLVFLSLSFSILNSATVDEKMHHIPAGLNYLQSRTTEAYSSSAGLVLGTIPFGLIALFHPDLSTYPHFMLVLTRLFALIYAAITLMYVYRFSKLAYGRTLLPTSAFVCTPIIIAFSAIANIDMFSTMISVVSMFYFFSYLKGKNEVYPALITTILALSAKNTLLLLIPTQVISYFIYKKKIPYKYMAMLIFGFLLFLNSLYFFEGSFSTLEDMELQSSYFNKLKGSFIGNMPMPVPEGYIKAWDRTKWLESDEKRVFYFLGKIGPGSPWFYVIMFLLKIPIPILILLLWSLYGKYYKRDIVILLLPILMLISLSLSRFTVGLRLFLPGIPFLYIFLGRINIKKLKYLFIPLLLINIIIPYPHYLSYFNFGKGYEYTIDSDYDWEQDQFYVEKFVRENPDVTVIKECGQITQPGRYLITAKYYKFNLYHCYNGLDNYEPVKIIGGSQLLFEID